MKPTSTGPGSSGRSLEGSGHGPELRLRGRRAPASARGARRGGDGGAPDRHPRRTRSRRGASSASSSRRRRRRRSARASIPSTVPLSGKQGQRLLGPRPAGQAAAPTSRARSNGSASAATTSTRAAAARASSIRPADASASAARSGSPRSGAEAGALPRRAACLRSAPATNGVDEAPTRLIDVGLLRPGREAGQEEPARVAVPAASRRARPDARSAVVSADASRRLCASSANRNASRADRARTPPSHASSRTSAALSVDAPETAAASASENPSPRSAAARRTTSTEPAARRCVRPPGEPDRNTRALCRAARSSRTGIPGRFPGELFPQSRERRGRGEREVDESGDLLASETGDEERGALPGWRGLEADLDPDDRPEEAGKLLPRAERPRVPAVEVAGEKDEGRARSPAPATPRGPDARRTAARGSGPSASASSRSGAPSSTETGGPASANDVSPGARRAAPLATQSAAPPTATSRSRRKPGPSSRGHGEAREGRARPSPATSPVRARSRRSASEGRAPSAARRTAATASADRAGSPSPRASSRAFLASARLRARPRGRRAEGRRSRGRPAPEPPSRTGRAPTRARGRRGVPGLVPSDLAPHLPRGRVRGLRERKGGPASRTRNPACSASDRSSGRRRGCGAGPATHVPPTRRPQVKVGRAACSEPDDLRRARRTRRPPGSPIPPAARLPRSACRLSPDSAPRRTSGSSHAPAPGRRVSAAEHEGRPVVPEAGIRLRDDLGRVERAAVRQREREDRGRHRHAMVVRRVRSRHGGGRPAGPSMTSGWLIREPRPRRRRRPPTARGGRAPRRDGPTPSPEARDAAETRTSRARRQRSAASGSAASGAGSTSASTGIGRLPPRRRGRRPSPSPSQRSRPPASRRPAAEDRVGLGGLRVEPFEPHAPSGYDGPAIGKHAAESSPGTTNRQGDRRPPERTPRGRDASGRRRRPTRAGPRCGWRARPRRRARRGGAPRRTATKRRRGSRPRRPSASPLRSEAAGSPPLPSGSIRAPRARSASTSGPIGLSLILGLPSRTNRPGRAEQEREEETGGSPGRADVEDDLLPAGAQERSGDLPGLRPGHDLRSQPSERLREGARVVRVERARRSRSRPGASAAATSARFVKLLEPGTRSVPSSRPRGSLTPAPGGGPRARRSAPRRGGRPRRGRSRRAGAPRARPGGSERRSRLSRVELLHVEVADEELVVAGRPGPLPFPADLRVREDALVPEVRPVEAGLGPLDDPPGERSRDQPERRAGDRVLRKPPPESIGKVAGVDPVAVDEGVASPADEEAVRVAVRGERPRPARPAEEEVAVPLDVPELDAPRRELVPRREDPPDERRLELRAADEVVKDVAEEDDRPETPGRDVVEGREEVARRRLRPGRGGRRRRRRRPLPRSDRGSG